MSLGSGQEMRATGPGVENYDLVQPWTQPCFFPGALENRPEHGDGVTPAFGRRNHAATVCAPRQRGPDGGTGRNARSHPASGSESVNLTWCTEFWADTGLKGFR
jgi:hypothetical protein